MKPRRVKLTKHNGPMLRAITEAVELIKAGHTRADAAAEAGIAMGTLYRHIREVRQKHPAALPPAALPPAARAITESQRHRLSVRTDESVRRQTRDAERARRAALASAAALDKKAANLKPLRAYKRAAKP